MIAVQPTPPPELAHAVRSGRWAEVRRVASNLPEKLPSQVALVAAIAERQLGHGERALALLNAALASAGELDPALRLEAAEVAVRLGKDPAPYLTPLLARRADSTHRHLAANVLREGWEILPLATLRGHRRLHLDRRLRRDLDAHLAVRSGSRHEVDRLLRLDSRDQTAVRLARWVERLDHPTVDEALMASEALLANGWWREAEALLTRCPPPQTADQRFRRSFLQARAAYRLGRYGDAATGYEAAVAIAPGSEEAFAAHVQRARIAELDGEWPRALDHWERARVARPREIEGWDGATRLLAVLDRPGEAVALARKAPSRAREVLVPRLAAMLLAHGEERSCREVLSLLPGPDPAARTVAVAAELAGGHEAAFRARLAALVADRGAGSWRDLALMLLPPSTAPPPATPIASDDLSRLATIASSAGVEEARAALERALRSNAEWSPLLSTSPLPEPILAAPVAALVAVGLEDVAARLFADRFPGATPADLAWSTRRLAAWGNLPAALTTGEKVWRLLGEPPASLVPDRLLRRIVPDELTAACVVAARGEGLQPSWLAAVVRRESRFAAAVRSSAGALGIAQIVPETARSLGSEPTDVLDPKVGLRLAASELVRLFGVFQGRLAPTAAAYNAGDGVVATWLNLLGEDGTEVLFAAAIPYGETARYVRAVVEGAQLFRHLDAGPPLAAAPQPSPSPDSQRR